MKKFLTTLLLIAITGIAIGQTTADFKKNLELAKQGNAKAQYEVGNSYNNGDGIKQDKHKAGIWWRKAAEQGHVEAQYNLGTAYLRGASMGVFKNDFAQAVIWLRKAAEQGYVSAANNLAVCYDIGGYGITQDYAQAAIWYRKAAEQGHVKGQYNLGCFYKEGLGGIPQDYAQAEIWYLKAAMQKEKRATDSLRAMFNSNKINKDDYTTFDEWYDNKKNFKAAEQGDVKAQYILGEYYDKKKDYIQALFWYRKAAEQGNKYAQCYLGHSYYNGQTVPRDYSQAVIWYSKAAEQGNGMAQYFLGNCYNNGQGVMPDTTQALRWYFNAAAQENKNAMEVLFKMFNDNKIDKDGYTVFNDWYNSKKEEYANEEEMYNSTFSSFSKKYVETEMNNWQKKGEFEKTEDYQQRVNEQTRQQKMAQLTADAEQQYIAQQSKAIAYLLDSYNADKEAYIVRCNGIDMLVPVPMVEAQSFKSSWFSIKKTPSYFIENDKLAISKVLFTTETGKTYKYSK